MLFCLLCLAAWFHVWSQTSSIPCSALLFTAMISGLKILGIKVGGY